MYKIILKRHFNSNNYLFFLCQKNLCNIFCMVSIFLRNLKKLLSIRNILGAQKQQKCECNDKAHDSQFDWSKLSAQNWPNMHLNMVQKSTREAKKRPIWSINNLFIVHQKLYLLRVKCRKVWKVSWETLFWRKDPIFPFWFSICYERSISRSLFRI